MSRLALLLLSLCLTFPAIAADAAKPNRQEVFGDTIVYYNAFTSSFLQPAMAREAGVIRGKKLGVLSITVARKGQSMPATISGNVKDLTGREQRLSFHSVTQNQTVSYISQFPIEQADTYTFTLSVQAGGDQANSFSFNQELFPGE